jgi:hypothetical protein
MKGVKAKPKQTASARRRAGMNGITVILSEHVTSKTKTNSLSRQAGRNEWDYRNLE